MSCKSRIGMIDPVEFDFCVSKMREFFKMKGFAEVHTQTRLSILAACEDPKKLFQPMIMQVKYGLFHKQVKCGLNMKC